MSSGIVERSAFEVGRLVREMDAADAAEASVPGRVQDIADAIDVVAGSAALHRPISILGAMFQALVLSHELDGIQSFVPEGQRNGLFGVTVRAAERRLRGVIDYLEQRCDTPLDEVGGTYFYTRSHDPFLSLDPAALIPQPGDMPIAATAPLGQPAISQPVFASIERQLLALTERYVQLEALFHELSDIEEARPGGDTQSGKASEHASRKALELSTIINGTRASTIRDLGLKARIAAHRCEDWWSGNPKDLDQGERACKAVLDDLMSAAGVTRLSTRDTSDDELRQRATLGSWDAVHPAPQAEAA